MTTTVRADESETDAGLRQRSETCTAVALGWQMAELFHANHGEKVSPREPTPDYTELPGVGGLPEQEKQTLRLEQLSHGLGVLVGKTKDTKLKLMYEQVRAAAQEGGVPNDDPAKLHVELLTTLTVANFRLGKAYSLGRALFEVSREPSPTDTVEYPQSLEYRLGEKNLSKLIAWCIDLKSVLPDHAGQAVADSLERWQSWARQAPWMLVEHTDFARRLRRQGERWRAILTEEKDARDLLTIATYIGAGEELVADAAEVSVSFIKRFWALLALVVVLLAGGLVAIIGFGGGGGVIGGLASMATALGISWKTASPTLSKLSSQLSTPLWEAELDAAIANAVTDPNVPRMVATPPSVDQPVPVARATDPRIARQTARQVWKRLDRGTRAQALTGRDPFTRFAYRYAGLWRGGAKQPFMPHDVYLSHVQSALETRLASKELETDERSRDELFEQFGPDDWEWIKTAVQAGLTKIEGKHCFGDDPCEHEMGGRVRIVLFGDWATGTRRAQLLAKRIERVLDQRESNREGHLIHLGDVYYCGEPDEYQRRFLRYWPAPDEEVKSWNMNGNHDMYSGGRGYFGLISKSDNAERESAQNGKDFSHQNGTSFFRIANEHWQIIGLDSAYVDNDFDERQLPKLKQWLGLSDDDNPATRPRRTILLSHHQLGSAHAQAGVSPGIRKKTAEARKRGRIHAWFWGHEHRALVYDEYLGVRFPVCIGNGGVPELLSHTFTFSGAFQSVVAFGRRLRAFLSPARRVPAPHVKFQQAARVDRHNLSWEKLGFVVIDLDDGGATATYHDEDGETYEIESFGA